MENCTIGPSINILVKEVSVAIRMNEARILLGCCFPKNGELYGYNVRDGLVSADGLSYSCDDMEIETPRTRAKRSRLSPISHLKTLPKKRNPLSVYDFVFGVGMRGRRRNASKGDRV